MSPVAIDTYNLPLYIIHWYCTPPLQGAKFVVEHEEWRMVDGAPIRCIYAWREGAYEPVDGKIFSHTNDAGQKVYVYDRNGRYEIGVEE